MFVVGTFCGVVLFSVGQWFGVRKLIGRSVVWLCEFVFFDVCWLFGVGLLLIGRVVL